MVMGYWSVAILFWQLSIDHIVNALCKRWGLAKTRLRHPSLPFESLPYPTRTICRRVRTYVRSVNHNQAKRDWPYSMSMGLCPTCASRAREPRYKGVVPELGLPLVFIICLSEISLSAYFKATLLYFGFNGPIDLDIIDQTSCTEFGWELRNH